MYLSFWVESACIGEILEETASITFSGERK
jgi:hypothetical protein